MDFDSASHKHADWKVKFRTAISKRQPLDAGTVASDRHCELGQWLNGEGAAKHGRLASFEELRARHSAFHGEAGKVAAAINGARYAEAEAMIAAGTPFASTSSAVGVALLRLKKEVGG